MKMRTKQEVIKEFNESLEDSTDEILFKRLMLELVADIRNAILRVKEE